MLKGKCKHEGGRTSFVSAKEIPLYPRSTGLILSSSVCTHTAPPTQIWKSIIILLIVIAPARYDTEQRKKVFKVEAPIDMLACFL